MGDLAMILGMVLAAFLVALSALVLMQAWLDRHPPQVASIFEASPAQVAFLFDGERLIDASPAARALLPEGEDERAWSRLLARFGPDFPGLAEWLANLPRTGQIRIASRPAISPP